MNYNHYKELIQNIGNLFVDESRKNVTFVFKDSEEKVTAHKCILEAASPVFKAMLSGKFAETDEVEIDDISPEVFKLFLSGIYLNDIHPQIKSVDPLDNYVDLYYAAKKYDIKDIRELSKKFMIDNCHNGNTNFLLEKAKLFNLPDLEAKCKDHFKRKTYEVLADHIDLNVKEGYFHEFFDLENLAVKTEFDIYMALQAMVDSKKLVDYSECLSKIRFLTMEISDILSCKLLSSDDKVAIISNIQVQSRGETPKFPMPKHFSVENKQRKLSVVDVYHRQYFWTALMLNCKRYEDYFEDFFKQMGILTESKERTKALIHEERKKADEKRRDVINKLTRNIFEYE